MLIGMLMAATLACAPPKIVSEVDRGFDRTDIVVLKSVHTRCAIVKKLPCSKIIIRKKNYHYVNLCGYPGSIK
jgi:hypothetical protein